MGVKNMKKVLLVCFLLFFLLSFNATAYITKTDTTIINNSLIMDTDCDETHLYSFGNDGEYYVKILKHNLDTKTCSGGFGISRAGYEMYAEKIRIVGDYIYAAGSMAKDGRIKMFLLKLNKNTLTLVGKYYYDSDGFDIDDLSGYKLAIDPTGSLVTAVTLNNGYLYVMKHTGYSREWATSVSMGSESIGAIGFWGEDNTIFVAGSRGDMWVYIYRFNSSGCLVVDEVFYTCYGDRGTLVSSLKFYGDYGYIIFYPASTECQGLYCEPILYDVIKFKASNFDEDWRIMCNAAGSNIYATDLIVLSDDLYIANIIANESIDPPIHYYRSNIMVLSKEYGEVRGSHLGGLKDYIGAISLSEYEDTINIDDVSIARSKIIMTEGAEDSTVYYFWVPKKVYGKMKTVAGWNLVSLPVLTTTKYTPDHFTSISQFLGLNEDGSYRVIPNDEELLPGKGYWANADYDNNFIICGMEILKSYYVTTDTWTLAGFGTYPGYVKVLSDDDPVGIVEFDPEAGYITLQDGGPTKPGAGYWVPPSQMFYFEVNVE